MPLLYHPESGCYWFGVMTHSDANNAVEDVTGIPMHEAQALEQIGPIDSATGKPTLGADSMTSIETNVPLPNEGNKKAARRARKPKENQSSAQGLIAALRFVGLAQKDAGTKYQTHCIINNHWCVAFDGALTIGCKVQEDISACPNSTKLLAALVKCGNQISISQLNEHVLSIKSEKFKASIDCVSFDDMPISAPDNMVARLTNEVAKGFECVSWICTEGAVRAFECGALLQAGSIVGCNGHVLLEYWHGCDLPPGMLIPKAAMLAVVKSGKNLTGLGFSNTSVTFHFEDESFIKTQIFLDNYPNYAAVFDRYAAFEAMPLPKDFFVGLDAVSSFAEGKIIKLSGSQMQSHSNEEIGAVYEMPGVPINMCFNIEYLKSCQAHFFNTKFDPDNGVAFSNGSVRGAIASARMS